MRCWDPGTTVLISPYLMHRDAVAWPEPQRFWPERWLDASGYDGREGQRTDGSSGRPGMRMHSALADMGPNGAPIRAATRCSAVRISLCRRQHVFAARLAAGLRLARMRACRFCAGAFVPFGAGRRNCIGTGATIFDLLCCIGSTIAAATTCNLAIMARWSPDSSRCRVH